MKYPNLITVRSIIDRGNDVQARVPPGMAWVPARPLGLPSFPHRIKCAWLVFTGQADALIWDGGQ